MNAPNSESYTWSIIELAGLRACRIAKDWKSCTWEINKSVTVSSLSTNTPWLRFQILWKC